MAQAGAKYVLGVDMNEACLKRARALADRLDLPRDRVAFVNGLPDDSRARFDVAISQNSFEHFPDPLLVLQELASALTPGGELLMTFGPPWLAPHGSHMHFFTWVPWVNILFSEATVMRVRSRFRNDGAVRYEDVEGGLNRMTVARFEHLIRESGFRLEWKRYQCVKGANVLQALPRLRELFINTVTCVLRKEA
jgi:SAM-dependent methyltransferase